MRPTACASARPTAGGSSAHRTRRTCWSRGRKQRTRRASTASSCRSTNSWRSPASSASRRCIDVKVKGFAWAGLHTNDFENTLRFFTNVLGLRVEFKGDKVAHLTVGPGQMLEIFGDGSAKELHAIPTVGFEVENFENARSELISAGVE